MQKGLQMWDISDRNIIQSRQEEIYDCLYIYLRTQLTSLNACVFRLLTIYPNLLLGDFQYFI